MRAMQVATYDVCRKEHRLLCLPQNAKQILQGLLHKRKQIYQTARRFVEKEADRNNAGRKKLN
jgi:shikimate kinase